MDSLKNLIPENATSAILQGLKGEQTTQNYSYSTIFFRCSRHLLRTDRSARRDHLPARSSAGQKRDRLLHRWSDRRVVRVTRHRRLLPAESSSIGLSLKSLVQYSGNNYIFSRHRSTWADGLCLSTCTTWSGATLTGSSLSTPGSSSTTWYLRYLLVYAHLHFHFQVAASLVAFAVCYRLGPPSHPRTLNLIQWLLQLAACFTIYAAVPVSLYSSYILLSAIFAHFQNKPIAMTMVAVLIAVEMGSVLKRTRDE